MSGSDRSEIFDDLALEHERLEAILSALTPAEWSAASAASGWTVADVVLHLAITEEAVETTLAAGTAIEIDRGGATLDELVDIQVRAERAEPEVIFERWRAARRASVVALRHADPDRPYTWAATPLRPHTMATTRLAEHWAHGIDITEPLGIAFEDTARLRHVARLAHRTLPYAFALRGLDAPELRCELTGPSGERWDFGPADAAARVSGTIGDFCRVAAQRLDPDRSALRAEGPGAAEALRLVRTYAA